MLGTATMIPLAQDCRTASWIRKHSRLTNSVQKTTILLIRNSYVDPSSMMAPFFANRSCDPFTERSARCILGTYVQYSVNVSSAADVSSGINFANRRNICLIIRNTGHEYNSKSTGAGALSLWM